MQMDPMDEDHGLEMGQRPSRKRRHLPLAATHSINERPTERKKVSTFKMSSSPLQDQGGLRHRKTRGASQDKPKQKEPRSNTKKVSRKVYLGVICIIWLIFIVYRVYLSIKQGNASHLSIVHFLSSLVPL